jgi:hypothetical protein
MINAEYGKPAIVRFINKLDENPKNLDRQDFGTPGPHYSFLTHLHNAHTAPESDGNPHYTMLRGPYDHGYKAGDWVDNLYLNWPAGNDPAEKQSFFWFHDHGWITPANGTRAWSVCTRSTTRVGRRRRDQPGRVRCRPALRPREMVLRRRLRHPVGVLRRRVG